MSWASQARAGLEFSGLDDSPVNLWEHCPMSYNTAIMHSYLLFVYPWCFVLFLYCPALNPNSTSLAWCELLLYLLHYNYIAGGSGSSRSSSRNSSSSSIVITTVVSLHFNFIHIFIIHHRVQNRLQKI